jgi:hypothetical protein
MVDISAVIPTWNSERYIEGCVSSIYADAEGSGLEIEIIIVDNGSTDGTLKKLAELERRYPLQTIKLRKNYGTTKSRNMGIRESRGRYLAIFDSDTAIKSGALKELVETFERYKKAGLVAPRLIYPDGSIQPSCKRFPTIKTKILKFSPLKITREMGIKDELYDAEIYDPSFKETVEVDYCISAAWMVSRRAIEDVGLFDENIFYSPEDVDFCLRLWLSGWKVLYNPKAVVVHHMQRVSYKNPVMTISHFMGLIYYFRKHGYWLNRDKIYNKIMKKALAL